MKLQDAVGKVIVRTAPNRGDRSYMTTPLYVEHFENGIAYYRTGGTSRICLMASDWDDDNWTPIAERFRLEFFPEPTP